MMELASCLLPATLEMSDHQIRIFFNLILSNLFTSLLLYD